MRMDDTERLSDSSRKAVQQGPLFRDLEHRMIRKDGSIAHFPASGMPLVDGCPG